MNKLILDIIRECGTDECIAEAERNMQNDITAEMVIAESPECTGMRIDPNEIFLVRPVVKAISVMADIDLMNRFEFILSGGCADIGEAEDRVIQYAFIISREVSKRKLSRS